MKGIIDRFEGSYAIIELENLELFQINRVKLPKSAKEGDVVIIEGDNITINTNETRDREQAIRKQMEDLFI